MKKVKDLDEDYTVDFVEAFPPNSDLR